MKIENEVRLDFKDVLIKPKRSTLSSRSGVDINKYYEFLNSGRGWKGVPIIGANMDTVGTFSMSDALENEDMMTCLHKHYLIDELVDFFSSEYRRNTFYTIGIKEEDLTNLCLVAEQSDIRNICIDVANGYQKVFVDHVRNVRELFPFAVIMAGNVCTPEMVSELLISGEADIVKVGIGPGSVCKTRKVTGCGYPQLSAIIECADAAHGLGGHICADGGCKEAGDVVKALAAGADFVMLGGMLAGADECEGEWKYVCDEKTNMNRKESLLFYGMSSEAAMNKHSGGVADYKASEGIVKTIDYKGPVKDTIQEIAGGIRSACAYVGARRLKDLPKCATFVRVNRTH